MKLVSAIIAALLLTSSGCALNVEGYGIKLRYTLYDAYSQCDEGGVGPNCLSSGGDLGEDASKILQKDEEPEEEASEEVAPELIEGD